MRSLIASDDLTYGLMRMFIALTVESRSTARVFRNAGEAGDWLGLGVGTTEILESVPAPSP